VEVGGGVGGGWEVESRGGWKVEVGGGGGGGWKVESGGGFRVI
jgi:hypothetical protein